MHAFDSSKHMDVRQKALYLCRQMIQYSLIQIFILLTMIMTEQTYCVSGSYFYCHNHIDSNKFILFICQK